MFVNLAIKDHGSIKLKQLGIFYFQETVHRNITITIQWICYIYMKKNKIIIIIIATIIMIKMSKLSFLFPLAMFSVWKQPHQWHKVLDLWAWTQSLLIHLTTQKYFFNDFEFGLITFDKNFFYVIQLFEVLKLVCVWY